jgi:membrane-associated protein
LVLYYRKEELVSTFLPALLNLLQQYGYPMLWVSMFVAAIGIPLPMGLALLAMGAFAALGDFNIVLLAVLTVSASVCGDHVGYFIGRRWGSKLLNWLAHPKRQRFISLHTIERSRAYFNRRGGWAVFLTRFLFSALGSITNLLAGTELFPYRHFLFADIPGEALGAVIPLSLGFIFATSWDAVGDIVGAISLLALALLVVIFLIYRLVKMAKDVKAAESKPEDEL